MCGSPLKLFYVFHPCELVRHAMLTKVKHSFVIFSFPDPDADVQVDPHPQHCHGGEEEDGGEVQHVCPSVLI